MFLPHVLLFVCSFHLDRLSVDLMVTILDHRLHHFDALESHKSESFWAFVDLMVGHVDGNHFAEKCAEIIFHIVFRCSDTNTSDEYLQLFRHIHRPLVHRILRRLHRCSDWIPEPSALLPRGSPVSRSSIMMLSAT